MRAVKRKEQRRHSKVCALYSDEGPAVTLTKTRLELHLGHASTGGRGPLGCHNEGGRLFIGRP
jgi:hypothetical protein